MLLTECIINENLLFCLYFDFKIFFWGQKINCGANCINIHILSKLACMFLKTSEKMNLCPMSAPLISIASFNYTELIVSFFCHIKSLYKIWLILENTDTCSKGEGIALGIYSSSRLDYSFQKLALTIDLIETMNRVYYIRAARSGCGMESALSAQASLFYFFAALVHLFLNIFLYKILFLTFHRF